MSITRNLVDVILLEAWMGHPKYSNVNMFKHKANEMVDRGVAKIREEENIKQDVIDNEEQEDMNKVEEKTGDIPKRVGRPPKNKMITEYKNK